MNPAASISSLIRDVGGISCLLCALVERGTKVCQKRNFGHRLYGVVEAEIDTNFYMLNPAARLQVAIDLSGYGAETWDDD